MTTDLKGKAVLITGASTGIGAAAARAFARLGARLVVHCNASRDAAEAVAADCRKAGADALVVQADVTHAAEVKRIVAESLAAYRRIDVLINNAGGMVGGRTRIEDYTEAYVQKVLALNCTQVAMFMHEVIPHMRRQKSGNIINVTSIAARHGGGGGAIIYAGAKGFVSTVTRGWAKEVVGDGIRVNCVAPGVVETPLLDQLPPDSTQLMLSKVPMGRLGTADEVAAVIQFLASDDASFITAQCFDVSGGRATY